MAERGSYRANKRADDRRKSGTGDNVTSTVKDTDGAGPSLFSSVFSNRSKSERLVGSGGNTLSGKNGAGKKTF